MGIEEIYFLVGSLHTTYYSKQYLYLKRLHMIVFISTFFFIFRQEYLDDLYEIARSRNDPMLLESLESFLAATVEGLLQKQSDNEKLDTALKR